MTYNEVRAVERYYDWQIFHGIYLEDSFVLGILESSDELCFLMEFVLMECHPNYSRPETDENYCYKKGRIVFRGLKSVRWLHRYCTPFVDKSGEEDYGNIDYFTSSDGRYSLGGHWGELIVSSSRLLLIWD